MVGIMDLSQSDAIILNMNEYSKTNVIEKFVYYKQNNYTILNNTRNLLSYDENTSYLFRSIICSYPDKKVLCFSPPSISDISKFKMNENLSHLLINESVEGVMINLFYDFRSECWTIATKSGVGGDYCYNKYKKKKHLVEHNINKSFYKMFLEALRCSENDELNDVVFLKYLPKNMSYSFVMQHPENVICLPITEIKLYLVSIYLINNKPGNIAEIRYINPLHYQKWNIFKNLIGIIEFPEIYENRPMEEFLLEIPSIHEKITGRGKMITNLKTGQRHLIEDIEYMKLFIRKGHQNKINYTFLCLERIGKVTDYLFFNPRYKKAFNRMNRTLKEFIENVYQSYIDKFVFKKNIVMVDNYIIHINKLHKEIYLPSLRKGNSVIKINESVVRDYFMKMEPHILFWHLGRRAS